MFFFRSVIFFTILLTSIVSLCSGAPPRLPTDRIDGKNYVTLQDFITYYGFNKKWTKNQKVITLKKKGTTLRFRIDGTEAFVNKGDGDTRLWMSFAPLQADYHILIPEIDVIKTFDPVLRPWAIPQNGVRTIMIDAGHGGFDKGTLGFSAGVTEKTYTLDTAKRLERNLRDAGYKTLMTRRDDEYISLEDRVDQMNVSSADLLVSVHYNSAKPERGPNGFETFCLTPAGTPSTGNDDTRMSDYQTNPGNSRDTQNMLLAYCVQQSLITNIPETNDRGIKRARFVVIKEVPKPAILVECGFLSNSNDEKRIRLPEYRERLAQAICKGIQKYTTYVSSKKPPVPALRLRNDS